MATSSAVGRLYEILSFNLARQRRGQGHPVEFAGYTLLEVIQPGAFGVVCHARERHPRRSVALKLIPVTERLEDRERAMLEADTAAHIDHPNVVKIYRAGHVDSFGEFTGPIVYVAMDLLGANLHDWVFSSKDGIRPSASEILDIMLQTGRGLQAAHRKKVIHRDFKPQNVVLDADHRPRIVDFGLARGWIDTGTGSWMTVTGAQTRGQGGTWGYMAPEVFDGLVSERSDQFAFAVTLWELLAGTRPFDIRPDGMPRTEDFRDEERIPRPLRQILRDALAADPELRHENMTELLELLEAARGKLEAPGRPNRTKPASRRPVVFASLLLGAAGVTTAVLSGAPTWPEHAPEADGQLAEAAPQESPSCPAVTAISGPWEIVTSVLWAENAQFYRARGYYGIEVLPHADCSASILVRKRGDSGKPVYKRIRQDRAETRITVDADGSAIADFEVWLGPDKPLDGSAAAHRDGWHYRFTLRAVDGRLQGDWEMYNVKTGGPAMRGVLAGGRGQAPETLPTTLAETSCASQCRVRCLDAASLDKCVQARCRTGRWLGESSCGELPAGFIAPTSALEAAQGPMGEALQTSDDCMKVAAQLAGTWTVQKRGSRTHASPRHDEFVLQLQTAGCKLAGTVRRRDGVGSTRPVVGWVDKTGVWRLSRKEFAHEPHWALVGWDPAFGAADEGASALAAYRDPAQASQGAASPAR